MFTFITKKDGGELVCRRCNPQIRWEVNLNSQNEKLFPFTALCVDGLLSVAHISDDGMSILEPLEITATHVVVKVPHLSVWGVIWDDFKRLLNITVNGQVLLFFRPSEPARINVFLLQENIPLSEVHSFIIFTLWSSQNPNDSQQLSDNKLKLWTGTNPIFSNLIWVTFTCGTEYWIWICKLGKFTSN